MDKVKILHVLPHISIGGINRFVLDLCYFQSQHTEVEVGIYIASKDNAHWKHLLDKIKGVKVYWGNFKAFDLNPFHYRDFIKVKSNYDIVHWHVFIPIMALCTFFDNKSHIFTHHSVIGAGRVPKRTDKIKWFLFKEWVNLRLTCEVYNSRFTKDFWQNYGLKAKYNRLIYNGMNFETMDISLKKEQQSKLNISFLNNFVVGTSSNFIKLKRIDILIRAFAKWAKGKCDVLLLLVGDGNEMNNLRQLVNQQGIEKKVCFAGHQSNPTVYQKLMDICVFPSVNETFGLAALECMHLGKPTLCMHDGGGLCEVVGDVRNILNTEEEIVARMDYYYHLKNEGKMNESSIFEKRSELFNMKYKTIEYLRLYEDMKKVK